MGATAVGEFRRTFPGCGVGGDTLGCRGCRDPCLLGGRRGSCFLGCAATVPVLVLRALPFQARNVHAGPVEFALRVRTFLLDARLLRGLPTEFRSRDGNRGLGLGPALLSGFRRRVGLELGRACPRVGVGLLGPGALERIEHRGAPGG